MSFSFEQSPVECETYGMDDAKRHQAAGPMRSSSRVQLVEVRVGTSFLSIEQARENLKHEIPEWDFDAVQAKLRAQWNEKLSRIASGWRRRTRTRR